VATRSASRSREVLFLTDSVRWASYPLRFELPLRSPRNGFDPIATVVVAAARRKAHSPQVASCPAARRAGGAAAGGGVWQWAPRWCPSVGSVSCLLARSSPVLLWEPLRGAMSQAQGQHAMQGRLEHMARLKQRTAFR
jgi:hypothetical protein